MTDPTPPRDLTQAESFGYGGNPWTLFAGVAGIIALLVGFGLANAGVLIGSSLASLGLLLVTIWILLGGIGWYLKRRF